MKVFDWPVLINLDIEGILVRLLGQRLSNGRNDVLVGAPYASCYEFTEFLFHFLFIMNREAVR